MLHLEPTPTTTSLSLSQSLCLLFPPWTLLTPSTLLDGIASRSPPTHPVFTLSALAPYSRGPRTAWQSSLFCCLNGSNFAWHTSRYLSALYGHKEWVIKPTTPASHSPFQCNKHTVPESILHPDLMSLKTVLQTCLQGKETAAQKNQAIWDTHGCRAHFHYPLR